MSKDKHDKQTMDMFDAEFKHSYQDEEGNINLVFQQTGKIHQIDVVGTLLFDEEYDENGMIIRGYN